MDSPLAARLDVLADAFGHHGYDVRSNLQPGATPDELAALEARLDVPLPSAYRDLYSWSAGTVDEWGTAPRLRFRDEVLLPLSRVHEERDALAAVYDWFDGVDFRTLAPLATYEGSTLAVACGPQGLTSLAEHPVICFFQGIDVYYDSIESMVETTIAWVSQPNWAPYAQAPHEIEIWRQHNRAIQF